MRNQGYRGREAGVEGAGRGAVVGGVWKNWRAKLLFLLENS